MPITLHNKKLAEIQQGIALIQVLVLTAIMAILAMFLTKTAQEQVKIAQWSNDKAQALVELHSSESQLFFALLTEEKSAFIKSEAREYNEQGQLTNLADQWNFFDQPISLNKYVEISMQDQASLINIHFPDRERLTSLLVRQGIKAIEANVIVDNLLDWQDLDIIPRQNGVEEYSFGYSRSARNGAVPNMHDLLWILGIDENLHHILLKNSTINRQGSYSPVNSPTELLYAITNDNAAQQIIKLRSSGQLSKRNFTEITGIVEDDDVFFYTSNFLAITLNSKVGDSVVHKEISIKLEPYAKANTQPINILSNSG